MRRLNSRKDYISAAKQITTQKLRWIVHFLILKLIKILHSVASKTLKHKTSITNERTHTILDYPYG